MDLPSLQALCLSYCSASKILDTTEVQECAKLAEVLKKFLRLQCLRLVETSQELPILLSYSSDASSCLCHTQSHASIAEHHVLRKGKILVEFLQQRCFLKTRTSAGEERVALLMGEPLAMTAGKKTWHMFTAGSTFFPTLRRAGHTGISLFHLVADRAVQSSLSKVFQQRCLAYYNPELGPDLGVAGPLLQLTDWYCTTGCAAHDVQNSLKWVLEPLATKDVVADAHVVVEALRNSFALLHGHMVQFLIQRVVFDQPESPPSEVRDFWQLLGIPVDMIDEIVAVNPFWCDNQLHVCSALQDSPDAFEKLSAVMLYLFKWCQFSEARWATIGPSSRAVLCSLAVGLEALVELTRSDPHATDFHLRGFGRMSSPLKQYLVAASVVSWLTDSLLYEVLADERLLRQHLVMQEAVQEELAFLVQVQELTWQRLALVVGGDADAYHLRSVCLRACFVAAGYIHGKLFVPLQEWPWKLALGDVIANLRALEDSQEPISDITTSNIRELLRQGYPVQKIVDGLALLQEVPWTTLGVEQAHGSCATLHKLHATYGSQTLAIANDSER